MQPFRFTSRPSGVIVLACAAWAFVTTAGMLGLSSYSNESGPLGAAASAWPADAGFQNAADRFTLLMFVHPRCPCSQASISQLARVHARCHDRLATHVLFDIPRGESADWARTRLWDAAERIPGATVSLDREGRLADQFGARTSGFVTVYDPTGRLVFQGGITAGRGHEGDSIGTSAVISSVKDGAAMPESTPVFGCRLHRPRRPTALCVSRSGLKPQGVDQ